MPPRGCTLTPPPPFGLLPPLGQAQCLSPQPSSPVWAPTTSPSWSPISRPSSLLHESLSPTLCGVHGDLPSAVHTPPPPLRGVASVALWAGSGCFSPQRLGRLHRATSRTDDGPTTARSAPLPPHIAFPLLRRTTHSLTLLRSTTSLLPCLACAPSRARRRHNPLLPPVHVSRVIFRSTIISLV